MGKETPLKLLSSEKTARPLGDFNTSAWKSSKVEEILKKVLIPCFKGKIYSISHKNADIKMFLTPVCIRIGHLL